MPEEKGPFELGVAYRRRDTRELYVAMNDWLLVSLQGGELREVRPQSRRGYSAHRGISVEELCERWGVALEQLDRVTPRYLRPSQSGIKPRPRGARRELALERDVWRGLRTARGASAS